MVNRITDAGAVFKRVRDVSAPLKRVDPHKVALALGAQEIISYVGLSGGPLSLFALRQELTRRLHSTGGRPALEGTKRRQKIPLTDEAWMMLEGLAERLSQAGRRTTPGQVASVILLHALEQVESASFPRTEMKSVKNRPKIPSH